MFSRLFGRSVRRHVSSPTFHPVETTAEGIAHAVREYAETGQTVMELAEELRKEEQDLTPHQAFSLARLIRLGLEPRDRSDAKRRKVCGKCGITHHEHYSQLNLSGVKICDTNVFMYCRHCQVGICGGCMIDLGMKKGCPLCETELVHMD